MSEIDSNQGGVQNEVGDKTTDVKSVICANPEMAQITAKVESIKNWTVTKFKTTKQSVFEQLGKVEKTIDTEMDAKINNLRDIHQRYRDVYTAAKNYCETFTTLVHNQRMLAESFYQLSLKEAEIKHNLTEQSEVLRGYSHNGEELLKSLQYFVSSMETLCEKTIKDTLLTIQTYEQARLSFDVCRHELTSLRENVNASTKDVSTSETKYNQQKLKYEQLKEDVRVKIALLDENRLKVMKAQLEVLEKELAKWFVTNMNNVDRSSPVKPDEFSRGKMGSSSFLEH